MQRPEIKQCTKCGEVKSLSDFYGDKSRRDGRTPRCKACINPANASYKKANREKVLAWRRNWHARNAEKIEARKKVYRRRNRDKIAEYNRDYHKRTYENRTARKRSAVRVWRSGLCGEKLKRYQKAVADGGKRYRKTRKGEMARTRYNLSKITGLPVTFIDDKIVEAKAYQLRIVRIVRQLKKTRP